MTVTNRLALVAGLLLGLSACGSSSPEGGFSGRSNSCQDDFTPDRVAAGEDCRPALNRAMFCSLVPGSQILRSRSEVIPCDGVEVSEHPIAGGGFDTEYLAIRPTGGRAPSAVYVALHYLNADTAFYANLIRMSELAKARNVLVLLPQGPDIGQLLPLPGGFLGPDTGLFSRWPTSLSQPVENSLQLLDAMVVDARDRFGARNAPLYVSGLSNGAPMAYFYACGRADQVDAVLAVAGTQNDESAAVCRPTRPVGLVALHGTLDPVVPYSGALGLARGIVDNYTDFKSHNQCSGPDREANLVGTSLSIRFDYAPNCAGGRRVVLASAIGNGHNWPGDDTGPLQEGGFPIGIFGPALDDIDATIQGFDLLRYAAGH